MRPIERGAAPRIYSKYAAAIDDLEARLGRYCSYCERKVSTNLAVEHIVPKVLEPGLEMEWTNFLLACTTCNSIKGDKPIAREDFLWPDQDNTFLAFDYCQGGLVKLSHTLTPSQTSQAQNLLDLVQLERHSNLIMGRDKRWQDREEAWQAAEDSRNIFAKASDSSEVLNLILSFAKDQGFFSVWMTVFESYPNVKKELIKLFTGTATSCFDPNGKPIHRPGGKI